MNFSRALEKKITQRRGPYRWDDGRGYGVYVCVIDRQEGAAEECVEGPRGHERPFSIS